MKIWLPAHEISHAESCNKYYSTFFLQCIDSREERSVPHGGIYVNITSYTGKVKQEYESPIRDESPNSSNVAMRTM